MKQKLRIRAHALRVIITSHGSKIKIIYGFHYFHAGPTLSIDATFIVYMQETHSHEIIQPPSRGLGVFIYIKYLPPTWATGEMSRDQHV
jgi:hypothetical protein